MTRRLALLVLAASLLASSISARISPVPLYRAFAQALLDQLALAAAFAAAFLLNGVVRWPLLVTLLILVPLCLWWAWPRGTRTDSEQTAQ